MLNQWRQLVKDSINDSHSSNSRSPSRYDLTSYSVFSVSGDDRVKFLQGQLTNDIEKVSSHQSQLSAICNPKGRMLSLFLVAAEADRYLFILPEELMPSTIEHLKKYSVFYNVDIAPCDEYAVTGIDHAGSQQDLATSQKHNGLQINWDRDRSLLVLPLPDAKTLWNNNDLSSKPYDEWLVNDIQSGLPRLYSETVETFLPHNLNLPKLGAVSFDKGCYTGQEVVARMHYKGTLKSRLRCLEGEEQTLPAPGAAIYGDDKKVGEVVCSASKNNQTFVLGHCKDSIENTRKIQCTDENMPILKLRF